MDKLINDIPPPFPVLYLMSNEKLAFECLVWKEVPVLLDFNTCGMSTPFKVSTTVKRRETEAWNIYWGQKSLSGHYVFV